jgi:glycosyltransferase involved in cell wall biosynthesis
MRFYEMVPHLHRAGLTCHIEPLFNAAYIEDLQQGRRRKAPLIASYAKRVRKLLGSQKYDLVWLEKDALPWVPWPAESALLPNRVPLVVDYDDAVFHTYDQHPRALINTFLGMKHINLMRRATTIIAGSEYLRDYAVSSGTRKVELIPTVVDLDRYPARREFETRDEDTVPVVGWVGQRSTAEFLTPLGDLFSTLAREGLASFEALGIDPASFRLPMKSVLWDEKTEASSIGMFDIGIMPVPDRPFERGKCGYKLIQYMASGLPVIASPVGANRQLVHHGENGFLASSIEEWEHYLRLLINDRNLRRSMGRKGRKLIEERYSLQYAAPKLVSLLKAAARKV